MTLMGTGGVVPAGIPYTMHQHDFGRWAFAQGVLSEQERGWGGGRGGDTKVE